MSTSKPDEVVIHLTQDEAIVLFEFLERYSQTNALSIEHKAEQRALWNLCGLLEKNLYQPFDANYPAILRASRERLQD